MTFNMYLNFVAAMLAIVNPLGIIPLWSELTYDLNTKTRREIAIMLTIMALVVLLGFLIGGEAILELFSIKLPVFKIAGGLLLLFTGFAMVNGKLARREELEKDVGNSTFQVAKSRFRKIIVPLGIPMLSGPGSLTTVMLFGADATSAYDYIILSVIIVAVLVLLLVTFYFSNVLEAKVDTIFFSIVTRLLGILVTAIAVQFIVDGVGQVFPALTVV
ncbi:MAG: MarC family protein [Clostridia bacterium]|nr:MarC family protein [Clostridia bacterium]